jgi:DNA invertase Pin-like site-specific DNA recombinase
VGIKILGQNKNQTKQILTQARKERIQGGNKVPCETVLNRSLRKKKSSRQAQKRRNRINDSKMAMTTKQSITSTKLSKNKNKTKKKKNGKDKNIIKENKQIYFFSKDLTCIYVKRKKTKRRSPVLKQI